MPSDVRSYVPIKEEQLVPYNDRAKRRILSAQWTPTKRDVEKKSPKGGGSSSEPAWVDMPPTSSPVARTAKIIEIARGVSEDTTLLHEDVNTTLGTVRDGIRLGLFLAGEYAKTSGLERLSQLNEKKLLTTDEHRTEFRDKNQTAAAIVMFVASSYVVWRLNGYKPQELAGISMEFGGIPEFSFQNPGLALDCLMFYYGLYLEKSRVVTTPLDFVKLTNLYFTAAVDEIKLREKSFKYTEPFTEVDYKLEKCDFTVAGFDVNLTGQRMSIEFVRVRFDEIVGNRDAKHKAMRLSQRLSCFDPKTKRNIMGEFKAVPRLRLGKGKPGTGKTMQIGLTATKVDEYCQRRGVPFLYWPMPDTIVSTFQGGSAERMMDWMRPLRDPSRIIYAPIDDAENNLEERTRQGVSAGVREVIAVFLRNTEGASVVHHDHWTIELFTNIPDQLDRAVLSRVLDRFDIEGATTYEDFIDQDRNWWSKYKEYDPDFVNMTDPTDYEYMADQKAVQSLSVIYMNAHRGPTEPRLREIFERVKKQYRPTSHSFFGKLYAEVQKEFPFFSSRDARNIQQAVNERVMDFDLPEEWFDRPELFFDQPYERQKAMVVELIKHAMKGMSFAEIRLQEASRYLDIMISIMDQGRERQIAEQMMRLEIDIEARRRLLPAA